MIYLYLFTGLILTISFFINRTKTLAALKIAYRKFIHILPAFLTMLVLISIVLYLIPGKVISNCLGGEDKFPGVILASFLGSITLMPGFIAFPLCGILLKQGIAYMVLSAFTTTLMMVGVLTYPIEKAYFGVQVTVIRNLISFVIALIVAISIGFSFGELV